MRVLVQELVQLSSNGKKNLQPEDQKLVAKSGETVYFVKSKRFKGKTIKVRNTKKCYACNSRYPVE